LAKHQSNSGMIRRGEMKGMRTEERGGGEGLVNNEPAPAKDENGLV
jgi:hypothetical protein